MVDEDTPLGKLMHDFRCTRLEDMYYDVLAERSHGCRTSPWTRSRRSADCTACFEKDMGYADDAVKDYTIFLNVGEIGRIVLRGAVDTALLFCIVPHIFMGNN